MVWSGGGSGYGGGDYYQCAVGSRQRARNGQKTVRLGDCETLGAERNKIGINNLFFWLKEIIDLGLSIIIIEGRGCFISEIVLHTEKIPNGVNDTLPYLSLLPIKTKQIKEFQLELFKYFLTRPYFINEKQNNWNTSMQLHAGMYSQKDNSVQEN